MRFKGKHRVSKQDLKQDGFQTLVEKTAAAYYRDRQKFLIGIGVVVAVIVGIILLVQNTGKGVNPQAEIRFTEGLGVYSSGNMEQAEQVFKDIAGRFGRDLSGAKARYYLASVYYSTERYPEAKAEFGRFLGRVKKDPLLSPAAQLGIANCEEQLGNYAAAARSYEAVYRSYPKSPLAFDAMLAAARCYRKANQVDKAEAVYRRLLKDKPEGEKGDDVKAGLAAIQALKNKVP
ncbi:tetratricopeptide repeat protein [candidate division WOR-3 bacterium]|nr:tetratricopeptide repeat protein [candidate division WOR-3 bacterium]